MSTRSIYKQIEEFIVAGETIATATVVSTPGSTPREVGAKMIVRPSGDIVGTIGGGCGEADVWQAATYTIGDGERRTVRLDLTEDVTLDAEMVCGGVMDLLIDLWDHEDSAFLEALDKGLAEKKRLALATPLSTGRTRPRMLIFADGHAMGTLVDPRLDAWVKSQALVVLGEGVSCTVVEPVAKLKVFIEVQIVPPTLLIAGGGHIAVPLARLGSMLGFRVAVLDDRADFANRERFPEADEVLSADFGEALSTYPIDDRTYIAIMTRGHSHDMECLLQVIDSPAAYIGMIGSLRRVKGVFELVKEQGYSDESLARIHAPIGLGIGARSPEEIALSVMAEVVKARRGGSGHPLSQR